MSKSELDIPNIDYHFGASSGFFAFRLRETLKKNWSRRPSAQELLESFQNFDVYLFYFQHQASTIRKIDLDANDVDSTFDLASEPSVNFSDASEVKESKKDSLTLDDIDQCIGAMDQDTELNEKQIRTIAEERNYSLQIQLHTTPTRKRRKGNIMYGSTRRLKCNSCRELRRKVLRSLNQLIP